MEKKSKHKHKRKKFKHRTSTQEGDSECSSDEADKPKTAHRQSKAPGSQPAGSPRNARRHKSPDGPSPDRRYSRERRGSYSKDGSYRKSSYSREDSYSRGSYSRGSYSKERGSPIVSRENSSEDNSDHHRHKGRDRSRSPVHKRDTASEMAKERRSPRKQSRRRSPRGGERRREGESTLYSKEDGINRGSGSGSREHDRHRTERASRTSHRRHY